jgi:predicted ATPase
MDPIQIPEIKDSICHLYNPQGEYIGVITSELQLDNVRIQIAEKRLYGYYIEWYDKKITIDAKGNLSDWPHGFYSILTDQLSQLIGLQQ